MTHCIYSTKVKLLDTRCPFSNDNASETLLISIYRELWTMFQQNCKLIALSAAKPFVASSFHRVNHAPKGIDMLCKLAMPCANGAYICR